MVMKADQRKRIIARHRHSIWLHGCSPQALYWENQQVQELRFEVLLDCGLAAGDSVLDVGCGFGDLYYYLKARELEVDYTGIDLSPDMIEAAQARTPQAQWAVGDLFDFDPKPQAYDWVMLSGALNEPLQDSGEYLQAILPRLYQTCRKGLALNLLNADYAWAPGQLYTLQPYCPDDVMALLSTLSPYTRLRLDYLPLDASYFIWRDPAFMPTSKNNLNQG